MKLFIATLVAAVGFQAYAGDNGGGTIRCISGSKRTLVSGSAGASYNGFGPADLTYTIDGQSLHFQGQVLPSGSHVVDYVVYEHKRLYAAGFKRSVPSSGGSAYSEDIFQIRSVPGSFQEKSKDVLVFEAVIPAYSSLDPRHGDMDKSQQRFDKDITVQCELDVSL